jgi:hypothetical protein
MAATRFPELEGFVRRMALLALIALGGWILVGTVGVATHLLAIAPGPALRFVAAIGVLALLPRVIAEMTSWKYHGMSPDVRFGFATGGSIEVRHGSLAVSEPAPGTEDDDARQRTA